MSDALRIFIVSNKINEILAIPESSRQWITSFYYALINYLALNKPNVYADAEGYFLAYEAEVAYLQGRERDTLHLAEEALGALPSHAALLRAIVMTLLHTLDETAERWVLPAQRL